jgi:hypothetical protein
MNWANGPKILNLINFIFDKQVLIIVVIQFSFYFINSFQLMTERENLLLSQILFTFM